MAYKFLLSQEEIVLAFERLISKKSWNCKKIEKSGLVRLEVSDLKNKIIVNTYSNGTVQPQGSPCSLLDEMNELLKSAQVDPKEFFLKDIPSVSAHEARVSVFRIADENLQERIKKSIETLPYTREDLKPTDRRSISYRYKLKIDPLLIVVTQFTNGTLLLQGKADSLWDEICTIVEKQAGLTTREVASRFISKSPEDAEQIVRLITDEIIKEAENEAQNAIGQECYNFLEDWDKKYLVSSFCLVKSGIELPEYSCLVMPTAKSYEGYVIRLLISLNLTTKTEIKRPGWDFGNIWRSSKYNTYCSKNRLRRGQLEKLENKIKTVRHLMMHSNGAILTQITSREEAGERIKELTDSMRESYIFFVINKGK